DEDYLLAYTQTLEGARKYIDKLTAEITSNIRDTDGRPVITEVVSPEAFKKLGTDVYKLVDVVQSISRRLDALGRKDQDLRISLEEICSDDSRQLVDKEPFDKVVAALTTTVAAVIQIIMMIDNMGYGSEDIALTLKKLHGLGCELAELKGE
ncbi:MAG: hypothetical protein ACXABY_11440, partial [Candidatus Thorarchaeota archaeon]